ncbi:rod-binding protein [Defluviimonas sp. WL0002]|uniref:Rod-binding protein n=1 Tax=Albidovulum marisflavi TaxID=2984159 RepID=A0ABT2Z7D5_9RHOB|nr:rod-binding protein [Defluviimonas sp. WL0002]MCV2867045.1 rod-binding protein [Defluviimonas sp. WL0002]
MTVEGPASLRTAPNCTALRSAARELEASFLEEMLQHSGLGEQAGSFTGGVGEAQFASFLRREQALALVESGGIGLAQSIFEHLAERAGCGT